MWEINLLVAPLSGRPFDFNVPMFGCMTSATHLEMASHADDTFDTEGVCQPGNENTGEWVY